MFNSILIPLDGSRFAESALGPGLALSRATGAAVHLATVHEPVPSFSYDEWESAAWDWSEDYVSKVSTRASTYSGGPVDAWVGSGRVVDCLMLRADSVQADLIVMATHGRGALTRAWLGSTADAFLRRAQQPVLLVRPEEDGGPNPSEDLTFSRILVPLDGSPLSETELDLAKGLARIFDAELLLVRVVAYPVEIASPYLPHTVQMNQQIVDEAKAVAHRYLHDAAEGLQADGFRVRTFVKVDAQPGHAIARVVEEEDADLVVMATHGRGGLQRALLGSTTDKVIRSVHVPVLVRRPPND
jgi:nucleotide-binding universal stress UspA family protein